MTIRGNLIVGASALSGAPLDGHKLHEQIAQASILMQDNGKRQNKSVVELAYRGVVADKTGRAMTHRGKARSLSAEDRKLLKRRNAINPCIGNPEADHRMDRCHLVGEIDDRLHAVL